MAIGSHNHVPYPTTAGITRRTNIAPRTARALIGGACVGGTHGLKRGPRGRRTQTGRLSPVSPPSPAGPERSGGPRRAPPEGLREAKGAIRLRGLRTED